MTPAFDYSGADMERAFRDVGVTVGDTVFVQSSLGMLGQPDGASNINDVCDMLHAALQQVTGDQGTIVVPTYTYSFCKGEVFDPARTPSTIGPFSEYFRNRAGVTRSVDPIFSVASAGPKTEHIISGLPHDCFGAGSVYDRLCDLGAKIVTVGLGMEYATFRHHAEQMVGIPSRFLKSFPGVVHTGESARSEAWLYYVPALIENCEAAGRAVAELAREQSVARCADLGRNQVWAVDASGYRQFLMNALADDPWCTSKGPAVDVISADRTRARVGVTVSAKVPPYPVSENARQTIAMIADQFDLEILEWQTGTRFGNWVVPENWQLTDATVTVDDDRTFTTGTDFSVYGNSAEISATLTGTDLKTHLNRAPAHNTDWSLDDVAGLLSTIADDAVVRVEIDAAKSVDVMQVATSGYDKTVPPRFVTLSGDPEADMDIVGQNADTYLCVLPAPMAAVPVLHELEKIDGGAPDRVICAGQVNGWDDVRSILAADGLMINFEYEEHSAPALEQERA